MTVEDAKAYLRLETAADDALVAALVASARGLCEAFLGQVLIRRTIVEEVTASGAWQRLDVAPAVAITEVARVAGDGGTTPMAAGDYAIDIDPGGDGWVRAAAGTRLRVTYTAGLADDAAGVPAAIAQGIIRLAAYLYVERNGDGSGPPAAVAALWRPYRRLRLSAAVRA